MVHNTAIRQVEGQKPASSARARVDIWSTDAIGAPERFSYWQDVVCRAVFGISIEASPEQFSAKLAAKSTGSLRFARSESTGHRIARSHRDIAASADHYSIYLQIGGRTTTSMSGQTFELNAGDVAVFDGRLPFRALHGGRRAIAVVPRAMVERRAPWLRNSPPRAFSANSSYVDLIRGHLLELSAADSALSESAISVLTDNLCNLVALATANDLTPGRLPSELQTEALLAFCRQNLHNTDLSPQLAADHLGISIRTVHSRFRHIGQTFGQWVLNNRLDACGMALRDEKQRQSNISEIAYRWGFNDLSHFNRAFRARFRMAPGEWRNMPVTLEDSPPVLWEAYETSMPPASTREIEGIDRSFRCRPVPAPR
jgi:AraC-like DNA-binding protein